ncbi:defense against restriction DarA-related protein [Poseidonibacter ostreae]|uniref:Defence against restriction A C-terminal domain-containing protein n=1 Tax=Poseidonibacter ostreae TaxID=2654171 RepID=A0A6L4WWQ4_9BACT|nr:hypothetical protein [Poseidonibacter ostreae]KAB7891368.1 hypothetical protein GBG19_00600 [Poseidonibacter ostreae]
MFDYGLRLRPIGLGTLAEGYRVVEKSTKEFRYGIVSYEAKLSNEEINKYELTDLSNEHLNYTVKRIYTSLIINCDKEDLGDKEFIEDYTKEALNGSWANRIDYNRIDELISKVNGMIADHLVYGRVGDTEIAFCETIAYDDVEERGEWTVSLNGSVAGILVATGNLMCESEFNITNKMVFDELIIALANYSKINENTECLLETKDYTLYFDTEELLSFKNRIVTITDEDTLAFAINDLSSMVKDWDNV